jgi:hypothetical protein
MHLQQQALTDSAAGRRKEADRAGAQALFEALRRRGQGHPGAPRRRPVRGRRIAAPLPPGGARAAQGLRALRCLGPEQPADAGLGGIGRAAQPGQRSPLGE